MACSPVPFLTDTLVGYVMYLAMIAETLRFYQVQVHNAFLVLQPPVSASASLCSLQCACKAIAVQVPRLDAPSMSERAVLACLRRMFSNSPSLSVQVCTTSKAGTYRYAVLFRCSGIAV
jgi:hypothetical protein